jgi:DNA-binding NtrC family response regulator
MQMIEQLGYRVQAVDNARAALELADRIAFRLVVCDIVMAGSMDGFALVRILRQRQPQLPIVLATGYSTIAAAAEAEFTVLRKPYHISDLSRAMAKASVEARSPASGNIVNLQEARRTATSERAGPTRQDP